jgi:hypothetical protein
MRTAIGVMAGVLIGAVAWTGASQQGQALPGPGSGIVTVTGEVKLANRPVVEAMQQGDWRVAIANTAPVTVTNTPAVTFAIPFTLHKGGRYEIVWSAGERETVTVTDAGAGWVLAEFSGQMPGRRWLNLAQVRSILELH